ncbi:arginine repressor [Sphingomonas lutea]
MAELKDRRQRAIADLIRADAVSSQDELAERLADLGFAVTQATISRDLEQIGAMKVRRDGRYAYVFAGQSDAPAAGLAAVLRYWARSVEPAANLVVVRTPPGSAHLIGVALDQSQLPEVVGNICGDDTVFIACRSGKDADALSSKLRSIAGAHQRPRGR